MTEGSTPLSSVPGATTDAELLQQLEEYAAELPSFANHGVTIEPDSESGTVPASQVALIEGNSLK